MTAHSRGESVDESLASQGRGPGKDRNGDRNESQTVLRACEVLKAFRLADEMESLATAQTRLSAAAISSSAAA
jgi:hypothetical protein